MSDPDIDGELLDRLEEIFEDRVGPDQAITSSEIAEQEIIEDSEANPVTRRAIRALVEERGVPIAAGSRGYYRIETVDQLDDYIESLDGRIAGIQERKELVCKAWNWQKEAERQEGKQAIRAGVADD